MLSRVRLFRPGRRGLTRTYRQRSRTWRLDLDRAQRVILAPFTSGTDIARVAGDARMPVTLLARDGEAIESELFASLTAARRVIWLQRAVCLVIRGATLAAMVYAIARFLWFAAIPVSEVLVQGVISLIAAWTLLVLALQRITYGDCARVVDRALGLGQVCGTAVESIRSGADGRLPRLQIRQAIHAVRDFDSFGSVGLRAPWRDLRALALALALAAAFAVLSTLDLRLRGTTAMVADLAFDPAFDQAGDGPASPIIYEDSARGFGETGLFDPSLDQFMTGLEGESMTPEEFAARLAKIQAELARRAEILAQQRAAMDQLAHALSDSSATTDAAESIRRGNYEAAERQLAALGAQSEQLSVRARRDLATKLTEAARNIAPTNPELAARLQRAAQALQQDNTEAIQRTLAELGQGVRESGNQIRSMASGQGSPDEFQDPGALSELDAETLDALANFEGLASAAGFGEEAGAYAENYTGAPGDSDAEAAANSGRGSVNGAQGLARTDAQAGGAGGALSRDVYSPPNRQRVAPGRVLDLRGRADGGSSSLEEGENLPLVASHDGTVGGAGGQSRTVIVDALSIRPEQNYVPLDKRQIVRDYFSGQPVPLAPGR
ncbi:MAG: hypothetical protein FJ033_14405 [Chloroflexi bacterium]|nr:hypothetical protein [Chloroflexota bacterium]